MKRSFNIIFMGTPFFAVPALRRLHDQGHCISMVVTQPDRPKGRGRKKVYSPVKETAMELNLPVLQPESIKSPVLKNEFCELKPDYIVVVAYGGILPESVLNIPVYCPVNIHASLLPRYRGPAPIQWAVIDGETETGVCTMKMAPGLDTGDILMSEKTLIRPEDTASALHDRLSNLGAQILIPTLKNFASGTLQPIQQDHSRATYAPMLKKSDGRLNWNRSAGELYNFIRGINPWPGAFSFHGNNRLKIISAIPIDAHHEQEPGTVLQGFPDELRIAVCDGALSVLEIQGASGKKLPIKDFLRGYSLPPGSRLN